MKEVQIEEKDKLYDHIIEVFKMEFTTILQYFDLQELCRLTYITLYMFYSTV